MGLYVQAFPRCQCEVESVKSVSVPSIKTQNLFAFQFSLFSFRLASPQWLASFAPCLAHLHLLLHLHPLLHRPVVLALVLPVVEVEVVPQVTHVKSRLPSPSCGNSAYRIHVGMRSFAPSVDLCCICSMSLCCLLTA